VYVVLILNVPEGKMKRTTIWLDEKQIEFLNREKRNKGIGKSEYLRRVLNERILKSEGGLNGKDKDVLL